MRSLRVAVILLTSVLIAGLAVPASGIAAIHVTRVLPPTGGGFAPTVGFQRTADGTLHLASATTTSGSGVNGIVTRTISASGKVGPQVQALSGWGAGAPGLVALPNGTLITLFGVIPTPPSPTGIWSIASTNGGLNWSAPVFSGNGATNEALSYGSPITGQLVGGSPAITINVAGNLVIQRGLGPTATSYQVSTPPSYDGFVGDVHTAVDAQTGQLVASWDSIATPGGDFIETVAPTPGTPQLVPGQGRNDVVISGRDKGAGVFGAYTPDNARVRLLKYGGGSVAVGKVNGLVPQTLGTATGKDGRIWVMWGSDSKGLVAVTRSNMAVTRFERLQIVHTTAVQLWRLFGDGRLGPLDLLVDETPTPKSGQPLVEGAFYARLLPILSASTSAKPIKNKVGHVVGFKLTVKVTDAGDPVAGAKVVAKGKKATTSSTGVATLKIGGTSGSKVQVTITSPGYHTLKARVKLP